MTDRRYPLYWPEGWPRTPRHRRRNAAYKVSEATARNDLLHSLHLMRAHNIVLSTNVRLRHDGLPYANQRTPDECGVAVYWTQKGKDQVIACDAYLSLRDNYRAVGLALEALRQLERCGASEILNRAYTGFSALPAAGETTKVSWRVVLNLDPGPLTAEQVQEAFRRVAKEAHPDRPGGSAEAMREAIQARDAGMKEASRG